MLGKEEEIVTAAKEVFVRYGYKRVTMADLAEAAKISRPALYLVFRSKEQVFRSVVERVFASMLDEIREGIIACRTAKEKLTFACEVWSVRPFEMIRASPDARDLLESSYEVAAKTTKEAARDFTSILTGVLGPLVLRQHKVDLPAIRIAQLLVSSLSGFKESAETTEQLRTLIAGLITVVLASLEESDEIENHGKRRISRNK